MSGGRGRSEGRRGTRGGGSNTIVAHIALGAPRDSGGLKKKMTDGELAVLVRTFTYLCKEGEKTSV